MPIRKVERKTGKGWAYEVRDDFIDPVTGKRRQPSIGTFEIRKDAEQALRKAQVARERGGYIDRSSVTLSELIDAWLKEKAREISANSLHDYETACRLYIKPTLGQLAGQKLTPERVASVYEEWQTASSSHKALSARMVQRCHLVLSQVLERGVRLGILSRNVCDAVRQPRIVRAQMQTWTAEDLAVFLDHAKDDALAPAWFLMALEGVRRGEALGLRWSDINWQNGTAHIVQTVAPDKANRGAPVILPPKTASSARTIRLTKDTLAILKAHQDRQKFLYAIAGLLWQDHDLVTATAHGTPINPNNIPRSFQRLLILSGAKPIRVHDMRHTSATLLLQGGENVKVVSERLGHKSVTITLDLYAHVTPHMQESAANTMSALLAKGRGTA